MSSVVKMILPVVAPMLSKLGGTLKEMDTKYGVEGSMWLIKAEPKEDGTEQVSLLFMNEKIVRNEEGKIIGRQMCPTLDLETKQHVKFNIEKLIEIIAGGSAEEDEE